MHKGVEMMHAVFTFDRKSSLVVDSGKQATLHVFADNYIFLLDLVAEGNRLLHSLPGLSAALLVEEPLENGQGLCMAQRQDDVRGHVVRIDVDHEIGEYPVVKYFVVGPDFSVAAPR